MKKSCDLIVVIPIGPNEVPEYVLDTIASVTRYAGAATQIIVVDDSGKNTAAELEALVPSLDVVATPGAQGHHGGLYLTLSLGYLHAVNHYDFKVLLKLDTDALVIGDRPDIDAIEFFERHPKTGVIGLYGHATKPDLDDHHWSKSRLQAEARLRNILEDPLRYLSLRRLIRAATANGFRPGDYIFGGSYFMSSNCVRKLAEAKLLLKKELGRSLLEEDHIFGLLARVAGFELGEFASGELPMALEWKRLPCAPEELIARKKKVTHSVRSWEDLGEAEIREFFRQRRSA